MNYQEFLSTCLDGVKKIVGKEGNVKMYKVNKNNGVVLDGIIIMEEGKNFSPTIYLNSLYEKYKSGTQIEDIIEDIYMIFLSNRNNIKIPEGFFLDFEKLKSFVAFKLINYDKNKKLLEDIPYRRWKNLALVYYVVCDELHFEEEHATILIHNSHLDFWNIDESVLFKLAYDNTPRIYPYVFENMVDVARQIYMNVGKSKKDKEILVRIMENESDFPMYVLTNDIKNNGAISILYDGVMSKIAKDLNSDLFVIPSSIHEMILIPSEEGINKAGLEMMLRTINHEEVAVEEQLSDNVYFYKKDYGFL